jgi:hypothetical protein
LEASQSIQRLNSEQLVHNGYTYVNRGIGTLVFPFRLAAPPKITCFTLQKYDAASAAMIALLNYGSGMPFYRLEQLQGNCGILLPASTQWEIVEQMDDGFYPVYYELNRQAAQGDVIHNDDTTMKVLALMQNNDQKDQSQREGIFTTSILSTLNDQKIALFFTGRKHAGENLADLMQRRQSDRSPPIQMCDALSRNTSEAFKSIPTKVC